MNKWKKNLKDLVRKKPFAFLDMFIYQILQNNLLQRAASLSYFLILAIFPFFIAMLNIINFINVNYISYIVALLDDLPPAIKEIILNFMKDLQLNSSGTLLSISLIGSIYIASKGIKQIIRTINDVLNITEKRNFISLTVMSFGMTVALIAVIFLIFVTQVVGNTIFSVLFSWFQIPELSHYMIRLLARVVPLFFMFLSFFCLYYFCPKWPEGHRSAKSITLISALFATAGIILTTAAFSFYVSNFSNYANTYGSLAGMIIFLIWLYLFGLILLFGGAVQSSLYKLKANGPAWPRKETIFEGIISAHERIN